MKPILFNTDMVRAILEGRKTVTRWKPFQMPSDYNNVKGLYRDEKNRLCAVFQCSKDPTTQAVYAPYRHGDILWVRETWRPVSATVDFWERGDPTAIDDGFGYQYRVDGEIVWRGDFKPQNDEFHSTEMRYDEKWCPSIHMPKEAARLFLRVTGVRVERLQDITEEGAMAEGVKDPYDYQAPAWYDRHGLTGNYAVDAFAGLWDSTIKPADLPLYGWEANPWVWVIEFERISRETALGGGGDG